MRHVALGLVVAALIAILLGWPEVGLFLAIAAALLALLGPDEPHRDAYQRNHARRAR